MENDLTPSKNLVEKIDTTSIRKTLQGLKAREKTIFIWQKDTDSKRIGFNISSADFILGDKMLLFNREAAAKFQKEIPLYFFAGPNTIIFKAEVIKVLPEHIVLEYPHAMQIEDARDTKRFYFKQDTKHLFISKKNRNSTPTRFKVSLYDLSLTGASFTLNKSQVQNLFEKDEIKLHSIDEQIFSPFINANIRYVVPFKLHGNGLFKVGIQFDRKLTESEIKTVI